MSATMQFVIGAAILTAAALTLMLWPLWRTARTPGKIDRQQANLDIFRDQLQELVSDRNEGLLTPEDFEQAKSELQRRLLEETGTPAPAHSTIPPGGRRNALILAVLIAIAASFIYFQLGNLPALETQKNRDHLQAQEIDDLEYRLQVAATQIAATALTTLPPPVAFAPVGCLPLAPRLAGVRIAIGVVQGLAFALQKPVLPISDLAVLAQRAYREHGASQVAAAIDARMDEVYWGCYALTEGEMRLCGSEAVLPPERAELPPQALAADWFAAGTGWGTFASRLPQGLAGQAPALLPHAEDLLTLALPAWLRGEAVAAEQAQPIYLRDNVATPKAPR